MQAISPVVSPVASGGWMASGWRRPVVHWRRWMKTRGAWFAISSHDQPSSAASGARPAPRASDADAASGSAPAPGGASFDNFYARHEQPLYGYLRRLLPTHEVAVEVAQEAFFRAWRQFEMLRSYDRPEAWLYRVATNLAISQLRRKAPLSFSALVARPHADSAEREELAPGDLFPSSLDIESGAAERDLIERSLRALPERQRAALLLAAQGFAAEEIAATLGATPANARKLLSRARERFRRLYDEGRHAAL